MHLTKVARAIGSGDADNPFGQPPAAGSAKALLVGAVCSIRVGRSLLSSQVAKVFSHILASGMLKTVTDTVQNPPEQRFILYGVSWQEYGRMLRALAERPSLRLTYDRGALELMTLSLEHESLVRYFSLLILVVTLELGLPLKGGGSTTFRRRRRRRGLEPDECFWIASEPRVRGKEKIDLSIDPPGPDLALEVDISDSTLDRMSIYAALRVPEVWRYDGRALTFHVLAPDGGYAVAAQSKAMPQVASADLTSLLALRGSMDENALFRHLQTWARQRFGGGSQATP